MSTNPLLEITIQQRSQDSGRESLQLPDNLLPSALHSCLWRDNSPVSCWAQLQVSGEGGERRVPGVGRTLARERNTEPQDLSCRAHTAPTTKEVLGEDPDLHTADDKR